MSATATAALYAVTLAGLLSAALLNALTWHAHHQEHALYRAERAALPAIEGLGESHPRRHGYHLVGRFRLPWAPNGPTFAEVVELDTIVLNGDHGLVEVWARPRVDGTPAPAWWSTLEGGK